MALAWIEMLAARRGSCGGSCGNCPPRPPAGSRLPTGFPLRRCWRTRRTPSGTATARAWNVSWPSRGPNWNPTMRNAPRAVSGCGSGRGLRSVRGSADRERRTAAHPRRRGRAPGRCTRPRGKSRWPTCCTSGRCTTWGTSARSPRWCARASTWPAPVRWGRTITCDHNQDRRRGLPSPAMSPCVPARSAAWPGGWRRSTRSAAGVALSASARGRSVRATGPTSPAASTRSGRPSRSAPRTGARYRR